MMTDTNTTMNAMEAILTRRSVRKFKDTMIPKVLVNELIKAAMYAPSACNAQPWHFIVLDDREMLSRIPAIHPYASMAKDAPLAILICGDLQLEKFPGNWMLDCSAAIQNLLLAAHSYNLGAVWTGIYPSSERIGNFQEFLTLPENIIPLALIPIGYPDQQIPSVDRYNTERIHHNRW